MLRKALGEKVKGIFYGQSIEVRDPISRAIEKKSSKPFLVNQMTLLLERGQLRIPNTTVSDVIRRQMMNYQVVRVSERTQEPVYTDVDEHALDAMIFAMYAFYEKYPELMETIIETNFATNVATIRKRMESPIDEIDKRTSNSLYKSVEKEWDEPGPRYRRVPLGFSKRGSSKGSTSSLGFGSGSKSKPLRRF